MTTPPTATYRRVVFDPEGDTVLKEVCLDIAQRYEIIFVAIGTDKDPVYFLLQSVPPYSPTKRAQIINSLTAREIFKRVPTVKKRLWGGECGSQGDFISTGGRHGSEEGMRRDVNNPGTDQAYKQLHRQAAQMTLC